MKVVILYIIFCLSFCSVQRSIHLSQIPQLTFRKNLQTEGKRTDPIPQLNCDGECQFEPNFVTCENLGFDHQLGEYKWNCEADMDNRVKFGDVRVSCEGFTGPGDQYVLEGSCGLFYTLEHDSSYGGRGYDEEEIITTEEVTHEEPSYQYNTRHPGHQRRGSQSQSQRVFGSDSSSEFTNSSVSPFWIFVIVSCFVVGIVLCCCFMDHSKSSSGPSNYTPRTVDRSTASSGYINRPPASNPNYIPPDGSVPYSQPSYSSGTHHHHHHHTSHHTTSGGLGSGLGSFVGGYALGSMGSGSSYSRASPRVVHHHHAPSSGYSAPRVVKKTTTTTVKRRAPTSSSSSSGTSKKSKVGGTHSR